VQQRKVKIKGELLMKPFWLILLLIFSCSFCVQAQTKSKLKTKGVLLENITWVEAEKILKPETVIVIPLGAAAKEHGPHLKLKNDFLISEYLKNQTLQKADVVIAPTINYHFYPAFVEYPGSTTLRLETARDVVIDICKSLSRYGVRRFYILNTGISTLRALKPAAEALAADGILMQYTDLQKLTGAVEKEISKQEGGTHADEIETSMMLYIAPDSVDMKKAVKDYHPSKGRLTRDPNNKEGTYSATGIWGDPTLATREKGRKIMEAMVTGILKDIEDVRRGNLPVPSSK
jgi:creatinine amidohydrolase